MIRVNIRICAADKAKNTYEIFELSARLLDDAVLTTDDNRHATQVANFGAADDQGVDVKTPSSQDAGYA